MVMAVLALSLIVLILWKTGALALQLSSLNKKFDTSLQYGKDFEPYQGPPLSDDEKNALASMYALQCALNIAGVGTFNPSLCTGDFVDRRSSGAAGKAVHFITGLVSEGKSCDGLQYGSSCVSCRGSSCTITGFMLPQDIVDDTAAEKFIGGYGDPRWLAYY